MARTTTAAPMISATGGPLELLAGASARVVALGLELGAGLSDGLASATVVSLGDGDATAATVGCADGVAFGLVVVPPLPVPPEPGLLD